jgi:hypothetical protein
MNICNKQVVEYHVVMEAIAQDAVLIPLRNKACMAYNWYSKAGAMRFVCIINSCRRKLQLAFA